MQYRREVDGLRALAVLPVIFFHAGFGAFRGGFVGVDIFFVISGYLITSILIAEASSNTYSLINFYERRARRILPALFVVMFTCLPFAWAWMTPQELKGLSQSVAAVCAFASNIYFWRYSGYFESASELKPLLHTWSLAVEEQFYLFFPVLIAIIWRYGRRWVWGMLGLIALGSLLLAQSKSFTDSTFAFFLLPTRAWELFIGSFVALAASERHQEFGHKLSQILSIVGVAMIVLAIFGFDRYTPFPGVYALVPTLGAAFVIMFANPGTWVGQILSSRLFVGVGLISYSAYLWHQPLFAFARIRSLGHPTPMLMVALSLLSLLLAYLSWRFIEAPFRDKRRLSRAKIFAYSGCFLLIFSSIGVAGQFTSGFLNIKTTAVQRTVLKTATPSPRRNDCHLLGASHQMPSDACEYFEGELSFATFGDSHTVELAYALAESIKPLGQRLKHFSFSSCAPTFGRILKGEFRDCSAWTDETIKYIAGNSRIHTVVVSHRLNAELFGGHEESYPDFPHERSDAERDAMWKSYVDVLQYLLNHGKKVVLVLQAPELPKTLDALLLRASDPFGPVAGVSLNWWKKRNQFISERMNQIPKDVVVVDPAELFCTQVECLASNHGIAYYFDDDHMSVAGARLVAAEVLRRLALTATPAGFKSSQ
jgi:peptidoglycan/LPS O-acetylase OafA/YrhL